LPIRNSAAVIFDSVGPLQCFGQVTKYGQMTKFEAPAAGRFVGNPPFWRCGSGDAYCQCIAGPRFEIDKVAQTDKRNYL
jgi:hypothetical protein